MIRILTTRPKKHLIKLPQYPGRVLLEIFPSAFCFVVEGYNRGRVRVSLQNKLTLLFLHRFKYLFPWLLFGKFLILYLLQNILFAPFLVFNEGHV